jgi:hypothetical protein
MKNKEIQQKNQISKIKMQNDSVKFRNERHDIRMEKRKHKKLG